MDIAYPQDALEHPVPPCEAPEAPGVERRALHLGSGDAALFAWYHDCAGAIPRDCVAVLCPPIGPEYTRSHRTVRHLADRLARAGVPALRFDYHGSGDSPGSEDDADRMGHWRASVVCAARHARELSGCKHVCLIGVRLGATLAALAFAETGAGRLVLWNPVVKGRAYARELQAIAMTAEDSGGAGEHGLESAGFGISGETLAALKAIDLTQARFPSEARVLVIARDDMAADRTLPEHLARAGVAHDCMALPGWNGMMADHQFSVVPDAALERIVGWVRSHSLARPAMARPAIAGANSPLHLPEGEEHLCHFGADDRLFGVLMRPRGAPATHAIVMLNSGSIHHVGPHRLYVRLARAAAALGHASLRFDHDGIGDSVLRGEGVENEPYPDSATRNVAHAIALLRAQGCTSVTLLGLCSGAQTAFHAGRELADAPIERLVLINPWYFYRSAGAAYAPDSQHYVDVAAYRKSMRDTARWKRLLRGEVDLRRIARIAGTHAARKARAAAAELHEVMNPSGGTRLSRDLRALLALGRRVWMYEGDGEPAGTVLKTEARRPLAEARRRGVMTMEHIPGGDHTFSRSAARDDLISRICDVLREPVL